MKTGLLISLTLQYYEFCGGGWTWEVREGVEVRGWIGVGVEAGGAEAGMVRVSEQVLALKHLCEF